MIVKWKTERDSAAIQRQECTRETPLSVWYMEMPWSIGGKPRPPEETKASKYGSRVQYHDSWSDARTHLMSEAQDEVTAARRQLELAHAYQGNVKGLRMPAEPVLVLPNGRVQPDTTALQEHEDE